MTMGETMKAVVIHEYGSNDVVRIEEVDRPHAGPGQLLVRVAAAGVNPIDWKIRDGAGKRLGLTLPIRMGGELVGTIVALGAGADAFAVGDSVFGMVHTGAFADYAVVRAADMVPAPSALDAAHAAGLPLAGTTAWQAIFGKAGLAAGQRLLITNSSGGVGSLAVQFAKAVGAHVTAVASGRNEAFVRALGADAFIDYTGRPFEEVAHDMDVVFDTVGGETFQRAFATLKRGGFMVTVVAFPDGEGERHGVEVARSFTVPSAQDLIAIRALVEEGKVVPHVDTVLPFAEVSEALARSQAGRTRGKIVLRMTD
jgi:NADPH:quinone reductase-like Zn-dependent oxidoreductase